MESKARTLVGITLGTCILERLVGSGGMGMVYLAQQTRPTREVAVKILQSSMRVSEEEHQQFLARFRREADVVARLDHVNILPIYEYGEQDELAYLVMPYLAGGSLRDMLKQRNPLSPQEALKFTEQVAAALDYAHEHKIVHRDVKPANMLFHADGRLVLVDFGIAHILQDTGNSTDTARTGSELFLGSVDYMAPEMIRGRYVDHRADIYELGVVLFQMLTGCVPFEASSPFLVAAKHLQEPPPSLDEINPTISPTVDAVVQKALAKSPEDRYMSAGELAQELRDAIERLQFTSWHKVLPISSLPTIPAIVATPRDPQVQTSVALTRASAASDTSKETKYFPPRRASRWLSLIGLALIILLAVASFLFGQQIVTGVWTQQKGTSPSAIAPTRTHSVSAAVPPPTATIPPTQAPTTSQQAQAIIQHYYDDINQSNYQDAYQQWGSNYQSSTTYDQFFNGYATTRHDDVVFRAATLQNDGTVMVEMTIYVTQDSTSGTAIHAFQGSYIVGQENGKWKLLTANLQQTGATATTPPSQQDQGQAQGIVQHYYNAINQSDYHTAYQLWGADYQSSHSYAQFASGFTTTKRDDVTFNNITQLAPSVFRVEVVIKTTENAKSGAATSTYKGSYVVGQENGAWKLLTANLQKGS